MTVRRPRWGLAVVAALVVVLAAQAWRSVLIKSQVNGRLLDVPVREGAEVHEGQLLAQIDPSQHQRLVLRGVYLGEQLSLVDFRALAVPVAGAAGARRAEA